MFMGTSRAARYLATASLGVASVGLTSGIASAAPQEAWDAVVQCESGGRNVESVGPSSASGYFQIIDGTWVAYGGLEFAPRAIGATYEQQKLIAERILGAQGPGAWAGGCGASLMGTQSEPVAPPPPPAAPPAPVVEPPAPVAPEPAPPVAPPAPESPPAPERPAMGPTYTVQKGDTLARVFGRDWERIALLNGIVSPFVIYPGQTLTTQPPEYVVKEGDTLSKIAAELHVSLHELLEDNWETVGDNPNLIFPGEKLIVNRMTTLPPVPPAAAPAAPAPAAPAGVVRPVDGPAGDDLNAGRGHDGLDLNCEIGDPVRAAIGGVVQATRTFDGGSPYTGYGLVVDVIGWDGALYRYAHLSEIHVNPGDPVSSGEVIAACGSTGDSSGSHLHFERRPSGELYGTPDSPSRWLREQGVAV